MKGLISDIKQIAKHNQAFRHVLATGKYAQVVVMNIPMGEDIGDEVHEDTDQILYLVKGEGRIVMDGEKRPIKKHDMVLVHAGARHNILNTGEEDMKIITIYSPPHHPAGTVHRTKADAEEAHH